VILLCAATETEAAACRRGIADAGASEFEVLATGVGPARAARTLARRLARGENGRPALVVSTGFAGALTAGLEPLSWVTASAVHRLIEGRPQSVEIPPGLLRVAQHATACDVVSGDRVVTGDVDVAGAGPTVAADMESSALAEVAFAAGVPFLVLRLLTDTPAHPMAGVGRDLARALAAAGLTARAAHGAHAALEVLRSPARAASFLRDTSIWRDRLRNGWRERARGVAAIVSDTA
jgi:nucleoside phosphorylase